MRKDKGTSKNIRCLIVTPFDPAGARVCDTITRALRELSIDVIRADQIIPGEPIIQSIIHAIESADFIIVDLSRQNPNVMYELGFAHALRKPTLIITSKDQKKPLPSDLIGWLFVVYDPSNFKSLREQVIQFASEHIVEFRGESDE
jgi:predicted nucleotide-binding protein